MRIDFVCCDDWEGLYINGILRIENHHIDVFTALQVIQGWWIYGDKPISRKYYVDSEWMEDHGSLPVSFDDIPKDKLIIE